MDSGYFDRPSCIELRCNVTSADVEIRHFFTANKSHKIQNSRLQMILFH